MKKIKYLILLLLFFPFNIYARNNYNDSINYAKNYNKEITSSEKYLYSTQGDLISYNEYKRTLYNNKSYLITDLSYWTNTTSSINYRYIVSRDKNILSEDSLSGVRVCEYVKPNMRVIGKGTISNPWEFKEIYRIVTSSSDNKKGTIVEKDKVQYVYDNAIINFNLNILYRYKSINCNKSISHSISDNKISISNINSDLSCVVDFELNEYTVTLNPNGGSVTPNTMKVIYLQKYNYYSSLPIPNRTGYTFNDWYTEDGILINNDSVVNKKEHTLIANWTSNKYAVTFKSNYTGGSESTINETYDSNYILPSNPSRTGYTFNGWYTASSGGTQITSSTKVKITSAQILYAHWTANKYAVTFKSNYTGGSESTINETYDSNYILPSNPSRTGYTFNGWYTASSGGTQITSSTKVKITSAQILYAHWTINSYTLTYNANGGKVNPINKKINYGDIYGTLPTPTRTGYRFLGWYTASTGGSKVNSSNKMGASNVYIYAKWDSANIGSANVSSIPSYTYTGNYFKPEPTVTLNGYTLVKDIDYVLSYSNNVNAGTATVTITGKGEFVGSISKNFTINKASGRVVLSATSGTINQNALPIGTFSVTSNKSNARLSVSSSSSTISASISGNTITWIGSGSTNDSATITVTSAATQNYYAASATYVAKYSRTKFFDEDLSTNSELAYHYRLTSIDGNGTISVKYPGGSMNSRSYNSLSQTFTTGHGGDFIGARLGNLETNHKYIISGKLNYSCSVTGEQKTFYLAYLTQYWKANDTYHHNGHIGWETSDPWDGNSNNIWGTNPSNNPQFPFAYTKYSPSTSSGSIPFSMTFTAKNTNNNYIYWDPWACDDFQPFTAHMVNLKLVDVTRGNVVVRGGN